MNKRERRFLSFKDFPKELQDELVPPNDTGKPFLFLVLFVPKEGKRDEERPIWSDYCLENKFIPGEDVFVDFN